MTSSTTDRRLGLTGDKAIKVPCRAATTANITLSGEQTIDSVSVVADDRVLVKDQTDTTENGIYVCDSGDWTRDLDADGNADWTAGTLVFVVSGSANGAGLFEQTTTGTITIGTSSLAFTKIATLAASSVTQANVQNGQFVVLTSVAGTNSITGTTAGTAISALGTGQYVFFVPANTNTGATTLARDSTAATSIFYNGAALIGGELVQNIPALLYYDGTQYQLICTATSDLNFRTTGSVSSATTLNLDTAKPYTQITGATQIDTITLGNGRIRVCEFVSTPQVTHGSSLICIGGASVTMAAGDIAIFAGEASSVVRMILLQRASGAPSNYSTGTWTPTVAGASTPGSQTYQLQQGNYAKIGSLVFASYSVAMTNKDAATAGNLTITGLPLTFASTISPQRFNVASFAGITTFSSTLHTQLSAVATTGAATITLFSCGAGSTAAGLILASSVALSTVSEFYGSLTYITTQ